MEWRRRRNDRLGDNMSDEEEIQETYHNAHINFLGFVCETLDPRIKNMKTWLSTVLLLRVIIDPMFSFALSFGIDGSPCLFINGNVCFLLTVARTFLDIFHAFHIWVRFRLSYAKRDNNDASVEWVLDAPGIAYHYMKTDLWIDVYSVLPIPQMMFWFLIPRLIRDNNIDAIMMTLLLFLAFNYMPRVFHVLVMRRRYQNQIFVTPFSDLLLNLMTLALSAHLAGSIWYTMGMYSAGKCIIGGCEGIKCSIKLACTNIICFSRPFGLGPSCGINKKDKYPDPMSFCLNPLAGYNFGAAKEAVIVLTEKSVLQKILSANTWGIMSLSSFGRTLTPTTDWYQSVFCLSITYGGMIYVMVLISKIMLYFTAHVEKVISAQNAKPKTSSSFKFNDQTIFTAPASCSTSKEMAENSDNWEINECRSLCLAEVNLNLKLKGHENKITGLSFSDSMLIASWKSGEKKVWSTDWWGEQANEQSPTGRASAPHAVTRLQFHLNQIHYMVVLEKGIAIYDSRDLTCVKQWAPPQESSPSITHATYSCDCDYIYASFGDGSVGVFTSTTLVLKCRINPGAYLSNHSRTLGVHPIVIAAHPSKPNQFVVGSSNGEVYVIEPMGSEGKWGPVPPLEDGAGASIQ